MEMLSVSFLLSIFSNLVCFSQWTLDALQNLWTTHAKENKFINSWIHSGSLVSLYAFVFCLNTHNLINDICRICLSYSCVWFLEYMYMSWHLNRILTQKDGILWKWKPFAFWLGWDRLAFGYRTYLKWSHDKHFPCISPKYAHWMYAKLMTRKMQSSYTCDSHYMTTLKAKLNSATIKLKNENNNKKKVMGETNNTLICTSHTHMNKHTKPTRTHTFPNGHKLKRQILPSRRPATT